MIYHIPFPFPVTFPIHIFGAEEVVSILDFILILVLGLSSIYGFFKGFLTEVLSLLTWVIAVSAAYAFGGQFEIIFQSIFTSEVLRLWISRLLILAFILFIGPGQSKSFKSHWLKYFWRHDDWSWLWLSQRPCFNLFIDVDSGRHAIVC